MQCITFKPCNHYAYIHTYVRVLLLKLTFFYHVIHLFMYLLLLCIADVHATIFVPEEIPSLLSVIYSNLPPIKKGKSKGHCLNYQKFSVTIYSWRFCFKSWSFRSFSKNMILYTHLMKLLVTHIKDLHLIQLIKLFFILRPDSTK